MVMGLDAKDLGSIQQLPPPQREMLGKEKATHRITGGFIERI